MAYARFSYADVYVFMSVGGHLECCACWIEGMDGTWVYNSTQDMIDHLAKHRAYPRADPADRRLPR